MARKKKNAPEIELSESDDAAASATAGTLPEESSEPATNDQLPVEADSDAEPREQPDAVAESSGEEEEEFQDTVEAILARKRQMMAATKESESAKQTPSEKIPEEAPTEPERPESVEASPAGEQAARERKSPESDAPQSASRREPQAVPARFRAGATEDLSAVGPESRDAQANASPPEDIPPVAEDLTGNEPRNAVVNGAREEPAPASADAPAGAAAPPASIGVRAITIFIGTALLAAIVMGAAVSYRYERTQRQLMTQFTGALNSLEQHLAAGRTASPVAPVAREPQVEAPKTYDDYALMLNKANQLFNEGRFRDAAGQYRAALEAFPSGSMSDQAHYRLGECLMRTGMADAAAEHFRVVAEGFPGSPYYARSALELSRSFMNREQYAQARRILYQIIGARARLAEEDPESLERAYYALGRTLEGEAEVAERMRAEQKIEFGSEAQSGGSQ